MNPSDFEILSERCPFLAYIKFQEEELIGIIQNLDTQIVSIYAYSELKDSKERAEFLSLGQEWWDNSNHQIPINIFLRESFDKFKKILKCLPRKDVTEILGLAVSLDDIFQKRIKRRRIQLVRNMDRTKKS